MGDPSEKKGGKGKALEGGKKDSGEAFKKDKKAGGAKEKCPLAKDRWLKVKWSKADAYCGDDVALQGTAKGIEKTVTGKGQVEVKDQGSVAKGLEAKGKDSFKLAWKVDNVAFEAPKKGEKVPDELPAAGKLSADGLDATTEKALAVKRLPDKALEAVTFNCSSPKKVNGTSDYAWTASFRVGVEGTTLQVRQTLQIKKAWLGKWVSFDAKADKLKQGFGFIKKSGAKWKYYDDTAKSWKTLPRDIGKYTVNDLTFVKSGEKFVSRDDGGSFTWPGAFEEPKNYETQKTAWLKNIHDTWDGKFALARKDAKGKAEGCCRWPIEVRVNWSDAAGDKLVYAVWAANFELSNAKDWYLSDPEPEMAGHECGHLLGAYDEYPGGAIHPATKKIEDDSIMGQNLTKAHERHLDGLRDEVKKKVKSWIGRGWELEVKKR
jgi:hypothetical protein